MAAFQISYLLLENEENSKIHSGTALNART